MAFFKIFFLTWSRTGFLRYPSKTAQEMAQNPDGSFHKTVITAGLRSRAQEELEKGQGKIWAVQRHACQQSPGLTGLPTC